MSTMVCYMSMICVLRAIMVCYSMPMMLFCVSMMVCYTKKMMVMVMVAARFLEMHMYITSALQKTDMKAVGLQLALELLHEKVQYVGLRGRGCVRKAWMNIAEFKRGLSCRNSGGEMSDSVDKVRNS
jgi:hypothetical protein